MIKTAEELGDLAIKITQIVRDSDTPTADILHILMDEQLDAIRHGMTIAADVVCDDDSPKATELANAILIARDNLKEI